MDLLHDIPCYWKKQIDSRVADLPLIESSYQIPLIIFTYLYFVLVYGPRFMKNRPSYSLNMFMKLYNIVQIVTNVWLIYDQFDAGLFSKTKLMCPVFDYSYDYISMRIVKGLWYYFLLKILDYVETIVFVLRKKDNQISGLHLYHHVSTLLLAWIGVRYYAIAPSNVVSLINCFIHAIMYTYYFLATCGPSVQLTVAPIKRWITITQMIQFVVLILYASHVFVLDSCLFVDSSIVIILILNLLINFYMFYHFYKQTYVKCKKQ